MRIKKTSNTRALAGKVVNVKNNSTTDAYSCDYINKLHNYSTTEQVVGTWIDGKPIYRKVYTTYTITTGTPVDTIVLDSAFNNKNIVNSYGKIQVKSGTNVWDVIIGSPDVGFGLISTVNHALHSGILFFNRTTSAYGYLQSVNIVVEYTKTTD